MRFERVSHEAWDYSRAFDGSSESWLVVCKDLDQPERFVYAREVHYSDGSEEEFVYDSECPFWDGYRG